MCSRSSENIFHFSSDIILIQFKGNPALFWRHGAARQECMSLACGMGNVVFHILYWLYNVWINFWTLPKFKNGHGLSSRIFTPQKRHSSGVIQNGSTKNFQMQVFGWLTKSVALKMFCFRLFSFLKQTPHGALKKHCFWGGLKLDRWVYLGFLQHYT